jgi:transposase InsO family protein
MQCVRVFGQEQKLKLKLLITSKNGKGGTQTRDFSLLYELLEQLSYYWNNRRICSSTGGIPPAAKRSAYMKI